MALKRKSRNLRIVLGMLFLNVVMVALGVNFLANKSNRIEHTVSAAGTYRFVSPNGDDSYPGTLTQPWKTLNKAAVSVLPGDTVSILPGTYKEKVVMVNSGSPDNYITFSADPGTVILDGTGIILTSGGNDGLIQVAGKSYIKIQGLTIKNSSQNGVNIQADSSGNKSKFIEVSGLNILNSTQVGIKVQKSENVLIKNNSINYVKYSSGIGVWTSDRVVVDKNKIVNAHISSEANGGHEESLSVASTTNFEVSNNDISMNGYVGVLGNEGIDIKEASRYGKVHHNYIHDFSGNGGALYVDAWRAVSPSLTNVDIYNNYLKNTANGILVGSEQGGIAEYINVFNNIVFNTGSVGIGIPGRTGDGLRKNVNIYNNTIYKAQYNGGAGIYITSGNINNIAIRNNIVYFTNYNGAITAASAEFLPNIKADHNLVYGSKFCSDKYPNCVEISNNPAGFSGIYGNTTADPKFLSLTIPNLHVQSTSPALDKGADLRTLVAKDYDGTVRPQGLAFDIGAFEFLVTPIATPVPVVTNILKNSSFEATITPWYSPWWLDKAFNTAGTLSKVTTGCPDGSSCARVDVTSSPATAWYTQFFQDKVIITANKSYKLSFWAKSSVSKTIPVVIQKIGSPYTQYFNKKITLTTSWQKYNFIFSPTVSDTNVKLTFFLGDSKSSTWFDGFYFGL